MYISRRVFFGVPLFGSSVALAATRERPPVQTTPKQAATRLLSASWKSPYDRQWVWGFADRHSIAAGKPFNLMLSTGPEIEKIHGAVEIFRVGAEPLDAMKLTWRSDPITVTRRGMQPTSAAIGTDWPATLSNIDTAGWKSGYYTVHFVGTAGRDSNIAYIIVTNPEKSADILIVLGTNTYNAYNAWGGYSFYESAFVGDRAQMLSFDRPASIEFFSYDYFLVAFLEKLAHDTGLTIDYASNWDVHHDPELADKYKLLISGAHNEYMSKEEFERLWNRIFVAGRNTLFLGANAAYWQVRYVDVNQSSEMDFLGRQIVCFKVPHDPIALRPKGSALATQLFRDVGRPETMLMGNAYQSYFDPGGPSSRYPYIVRDNSLPFFGGTALKLGDSVGDVVGYEWDNRDPDGDNSALWRSEPPPLLARLDRETVKVLFEGAPIDASGKRGKAEAVYFKSSAGAQVFSAGSTRWSWGLGKSGFESDAFRRLNKNLILHFLG